MFSLAKLTSKNANQRWLFETNEGLSSVLKLYAKAFSDFTETSCEVTAARLRYEISKSGGFWHKSETLPSLSTPFQVRYGTEEGVCSIEHIFTVVPIEPDGELYQIQSYFRKREVFSRKWTTEMVDIVNKSLRDCLPLSLGEIEKLTGMFDKGMLGDEFSHVAIEVFSPSDKAD